MPTIKKSLEIDNFLKGRGTVYLGTFSSIARDLHTSRQLIQQRVEKLEKEQALTVIRTSIPEKQLKAFEFLGRYDFSGNYKHSNQLALPYYYAESIAKDAGVKASDVKKLVMQLKNDGLEVRHLGKTQTEIWWELLKLYRAPSKITRGSFTKISEKLEVPAPHVSREVSLMQDLEVIPTERGAAYRLTKMLKRTQKEHGEIPMGASETIAKKLGITQSYVAKVISKMRTEGNLPLSKRQISAFKKIHRR